MKNRLFALQTNLKDLELQRAAGILGEPRRKTERDFLQEHDGTKGNGFRLKECLGLDVIKKFFTVRQTLE